MLASRDSSSGSSADNTPSLFPTCFSFDSCTVVLPQAREFTSDPDSMALLSALRGKGIPLSYRTDREAVEWAFTCLLDHHLNDSLSAFLDYVNAIRSELAGGQPVRLAVLCDPSDCFSAAVTLVLLPWLRSQLPESGLSVSLLAMAETASSLPDSFFPDLGSVLAAMDDRGLLCVSDGQSSLGADSMWLLSLPSSMVESAESHRLVFLSAARIAGAFFTGSAPFPAGLHTRNISGSLSVHSLGEQALSFSAFAEFSVWLLSDLIPSLNAYLKRPGMLRSLQPNSRNSLFRALFAGGSFDDLAAHLTALERSVRNLLKQITEFLASVPSALIFSDETEALWKKATDACGRYITVAAEYDVTREEIRESGLENVRPVHRDSLADTDEEQLQNRILRIGEQMKAEENSRNEAFSVVGSFRAAQALKNCYDHCRDALESAEKKAGTLSPDRTDHLTIARQERRIRLLKAAVERSMSDLAQFRMADHSSRENRDVRSGPAAGVFSPQACSSLVKFLSTGTTDPSAKELRDCLPVLLNDFILPDSRELMKLLTSACRGDSAGEPLSLLLRKAWEVCLSVISAHRFMSRGNIPDVPLLPDLMPSGPVLTLPALLDLFPDRENGDVLREDAEKRGILAMLVLRQYRRRRTGEAKEASLSCRLSAMLPGCWASARRAEEIHILSLEDEKHGSLPFAVVVPGRLFLPARRLADHAEVIPSFVNWYDAEQAVFRDPCDYLSEGDRALLLSRLTDLANRLSDHAASPLKRFLAAFRLDLSREFLPEPAPQLDVRIRAVCGLQNLPAYDGSLCRIVSPYEHYLASDPVLSVLSGCDHFPAAVCSGLREDVIYTWRGIPFARENSRLVLESPKCAGEDYTLNTLSSECGILSGISDDFRDNLLKGTRKLLDSFPGAVPECTELLLRLEKDAASAVPDESPELVWPWDPLSPSVRTVLDECLGRELGESAVRPFSDLLAVFPARGGEIIGDSLFGTMCRVMPYSSGNANEALAASLSADAVLPPLSPELASAICRFPEGRVLLTPDLIHLDRPDESSCRVTITLNGSFPLKLTRVYGEEETVSLYSHDIPTLAVWPSVPFPEDRWHAYFVYASLPEQFSVFVYPENSAESYPLEGSGSRFTSLFRRFPLAFRFSRGDQTIGALPNLLPSPQIESSGAVTACIDFCSVGTSVVFSQRSGRTPLQGPTMVRTILNNPSSSRDLLRREFLPAVPVSALLPTASRIFRNVPGTAPVPFADGIILMSANLQDVLSIPSDALYTCLKWEEEKGRSGLLCLHQVMLMAALQARCDGADALSWRFALPDEMAKEGRETLRNLFWNLSAAVMEESGFELPDSGLPVSFASESSALGAYFRLCAWEDTRGGFMVLDIGACTADISLFLRGREQAVRSCQIPLGVHYMLLPSLLRDPYMLQKEFASYPDDAFREDLNQLTRILLSARTDSVSLRKARMALDHFLTDYYPLLLDAVSQLSAAGIPSRFGSVLFLHLSYLMMLSGLVLLQIAADPNKNDFLPEQMSLCLSGRGALLLELLPDPVKKALWHFLTMFRNKRVASLSMLFSAEKKMEIPVGLAMLQNVYTQLPPASSVPASVSVRPEELLPEFLLRFAREFPLSASALFPGFFSGDYYHPFSAAGEAAVTAAIDQSFGNRETPRPYDSLSAWIGNLLDLVAPPET